MHCSGVIQLRYKPLKSNIPNYASYTYDHPNYFVRYPHRKRNKLVAEKIAEICSKSWLDYGAGDGALLGQLLARNALPHTCVLFVQKGDYNDL